MSQETDDRHKIEQLPRTSEAVNWWLQEWGRQAVVDRKEPLNQQDVERLIKANGGTAEGLCLVERNMQGASLSGADLYGASLYKADLRGADLVGSDLHEAKMGRANLQNVNLFDANLRGTRFVGADLQKAKLAWAELQGADLEDAKIEQANLQGASLKDANLRGAKLGHADLSNANLQGADLSNADLKGASLLRVRISSDTDLTGVMWDDDYKSPLERQGNYLGAEDLYRRLKEWHEFAGLRTIAGEFHYREREAARKAEWQKLGEEMGELVRPISSAWQRLKEMLKTPSGRD